MNHVENFFSTVLITISCYSFQVIVLGSKYKFPFVKKSKKHLQVELMVRVNLLILVSRLLLVVCFVQVIYGLDYLSEAEKVFQRFEHWELIPIGKTASEFVESFITSPTHNDLKHVIETYDIKDFNKLIYSIIIQTFFHQIPLALFVTIALLTALLLMAFPCFISLYRSRQKVRESDPDHMESIINAGKNGWVLFECLSVCLVIAVFGILIAVYASIRTYYMLSAPFKYAAFTVNATYDLKVKQKHNYESRLPEISRNAFDQITVLYNVNDDINHRFSNATQNSIGPVLNLASSMQWQVEQAKYMMVQHRKELYDLIGNISASVATQLSQFTDAVKALKSSYNSSDSQTSRLDSLLDMPELDVNNDTVGTFDEPIRSLTEAAKLNLPASVQVVSLELQEIALETRYNPTELIEKLKMFIFYVQESVRSSLSEYFTLIDKSITEEDKGRMLRKLEWIERDFTDSSFGVFIAILVICCLSLVCAVSLCTVFCCGICGTNGFSRDESDKVRQSDMSNRSGYCLLVCCYAISLFLWICWMCKIYLFLLTALHSEVCDSLSDLTFFTATLDNNSYRRSTHLYTIFSSEELNSTMRDNIIMCQKDNNSFSPLPYNLIDASYAIQLISDLDFSNETSFFSEKLKNVSSFNISDSSGSAISNLTHAMDNVDIYTFHKALTDFLALVKQKDALEILTDIKSSSDISSNASTYASEAIENYESIVSNVTFAIDKSYVFLLSIKSLNVSLQTVVKQTDYLNWTADVLYDSIVNSSATTYSNILKGTVYRSIGDVFSGLQTDVSLFRSSMSFCRTLLVMYNKGQVVICNLLMFPIAVCWFGLTLICIFLFIPVLISVFAVPIFVYPSEELPEQDVFLESSRQSNSIPSKSQSYEASRSDDSDDVDVSASSGNESIDSFQDSDGSLKDDVKNVSSQRLDSSSSKHNQMPTGYNSKCPHSVPNKHESGESTNDLAFNENNSVKDSDMDSNANNDAKVRSKTLTVDESSSNNDNESPNTKKSSSEDEERTSVSNENTISNEGNVFSEDKKID